MNSEKEVQGRQDDQGRQDYNKIYWHSRRGMRELDLILVPFVESCWEQLDEEQRQWYRELLQQEDQDLYGWLVGREAPSIPYLCRMVQNIRDFTASRASA